MTDLESMSFLAVGRKYGVSDNAIRKWVRWYEYQGDIEGREDQAA
jgi:transposase-like protein